MFILYDLVFLLFTIICLPIYLIRGRFHQGFGQRLGFLPKNLSLSNPVWIHAVSVGEVVALKGFVEELRKRYPGNSIVISTVTPTGNKIARSLAQGKDSVIYFPLDFSFIVNKVINLIQPQLMVIAETEIWPNFMLALNKKKIPVVVVNARISDKSFKGYKRFKILVKGIFNQVNLFCAQTQNDADRLIGLGVEPSKVKVTGNMKFDALKYDELKTIPDLKFNGPLWIAASTHPGEEEVILSSYKNLLNEFKDLKLLIAPRHPERAREIEKLVSKNGLKVCLLSNRPRTSNLQPPTVFILDTIGELLSYYRLADIVFMGGSLIKKGGHNILEPASLSKPVIFGPQMFNFRDIANLFLAKNACIQIKNNQELAPAVKYLLGHPDKRNNLISNALILIHENQGATLRNIENISHWIKN